MSDFSKLAAIIEARTVTYRTGTDFIAAMGTVADLMLDVAVAAAAVAIHGIPGSRYADDLFDALTALCAAQEKL